MGFLEKLGIGKNWIPVLILFGLVAICWFLIGLSERELISNWVVYVYIGFLMAVLVAYIIIWEKNNPPGKNKSSDGE